MNSHDIYNLSEAYIQVYPNLNEGLGGVRRSDKVSEIRKKESETRDAHLNAYKKGELPFQKQKKADAAQEFLRNHPKKTNRSEDVDIYDIILSHLIDEGYAETPEAAEVIMVNMSEDWRESIVEELITEISLKTKMRAYAATRDPDADYSYGHKVHAQGERIMKSIVKKHGKKAGEHADAHADSSAWGRTDSRTGKRQERPVPRSSSIAGQSYESQKRTTKSGKMNKTDQKTLKSKLQRRASERKSGETSSTYHPSFYHR